MSLYDQKLYEFLTQEENFEASAEIADHFRKTRSKLIYDFWLAVKIEVDKKIRAPWLSWTDSNVHSSTSKMGLFHEHYTTADHKSSTFLIIFEDLSRRPFYGLWFDRSDKLQQINHGNIFEEVKKDFPTWKAGSGGMWFVSYKYTGEDFDQTTDLQKILPHNRNTLVAEYAELILSAKMEFESMAFKYAKKLN